MKLNPLGSRLIIAPIPQETQTISGLFLPEIALENSQQGKVIAVGPGDRGNKEQRIPLDVHEGDVVLYGRYVGTEIRFNGQKYLILKEDDALAVIER